MLASRRHSHHLLRNSPQLKFVESKHFLKSVTAIGLALAVMNTSICAMPCLALRDEERSEDLPVPVKPKQKYISVYGDKHLKQVEAQILALAKQNNVDWTEKKEDRIVQQVKQLFAKETYSHGLATIAIWALMNREDDALVRQLYHYDKIIEATFYQAMFRISDVGGDDAAPALYRIMHQANMDKDAMDKLRDCLNAVLPDGYKSETRVRVTFSDEHLNGRPAPEEVAQFVVPLRETLWRIWKSPTLIPSELHARAKFTVDEALNISNMTVGTVIKYCPPSVFSMRNEYKKNALKALQKLRITQPLPLLTKSTDVIVEFYGP